MLGRVRTRMLGSRGKGVGDGERRRDQQEAVTALVLALALALTASVFSGLAGRSASAQNNTPPLSIAAAVNPQPVFVGQQVNLYVEETNNTNSTFPEVAVRDWLPNGTAYVSATPTQGKCFYAASVHNVFCELGDLPAGGTATVTIVVTANAPGTFTNTAWDILNNRADVGYTVNPLLR